MIRRDQIDWRLVGRLALMLLAMTILPVLIGILLDWRLHTSPIITLGTMFLSFNLGIVTIYRHIAVIYLQLSPPDELAHPQEPSGEAMRNDQSILAVARERDTEHPGGV